MGKMNGGGTTLLLFILVSVSLNVAKMLQKKPFHPKNVIKNICIRLLKSFIMEQDNIRRWETVAKQLYIHYDSVSNHVLTKSIPFYLPALPQSEIPQNILLLNGKSSFATHDPYTGFMWIKGRKNVLEYLQAVQEKREAPSNWIDFDSIEFVHQLTPQEIADLLYISHAKTHLHSPFFYKLQNDFIYLCLENGYSKVYYRKIEEFLPILSRQVQKEMTDILNESSNFLFFGGKKSAEAISIEALKEMMPLYAEGISLAFDQAQKKEQVIEVPIFLTEDRYHYTVRAVTKNVRIGQLTYNEVYKNWTVTAKMPLNDAI